MTRNAALQDLLLAMFSPEELRLFLRRDNELNAILMAVPTGGSPMTFVAEVVAALERRALADKAFFDGLAAAVPGRAAEVQAVAVQWGVGPGVSEPPATPQVMTNPADRQRLLREELVHFFPEQDQARMVAEDCGLRTALIDFNGQPEIVWHRVVREAARDRSGALLARLELALATEKERVEAPPVTPLPPAGHATSTTPTGPQKPPVAEAPPAGDTSIKILVLAAEPDSEIALRVGREVRDLSERLKLMDAGRRFQVIHSPATTTRDLLARLREVKPDILHFSGHGSSRGGIALELPGGEVAWVDGATLARILQRNQEREGRLRLVVLNACSSADQAEPIRDAIGCVVGMNKAISDQAASSFSTAFYQAIGQGASVQDAYEDGCDLIAMEHPGQEDIPEILCREDVDPDGLCLL